MVQETFLVYFINKKNHLIYCFCGRRNRSYLNLNWILKDAVRQSNNFRGHCCREKQTLALSWQFRNHLLHIVNKTHVEHSVGFIQNKKLDVTKVYKALIDQIKQSAWSCHQNINAPFETFGLCMLGNATKNHKMLQG